MLVIRLRLKKLHLAQIALWQDCVSFNTGVHATWPIHTQRLAKSLRPVASQQGVCPIKPLRAREPTG